MAILNLFRLSVTTGREEFPALAERALDAFSPRCAATPDAAPHMLAALLARHDAPGADPLCQGFLCRLPARAPEKPESAPVSDLLNLAELGDKAQRFFSAN